MIRVHRQGQLCRQVCALQDVYVVSEHRTTWPRWYIQVQHVVYVDLETAFTIWRFNYLITGITVDSVISAKSTYLSPAGTYLKKQSVAMDDIWIRDSTEPFHSISYLCCRRIFRPKPYMACVSGETGRLILHLLVSGF